MKTIQEIYCKLCAVGFLTLLLACGGSDKDVDNPQPMGDGSCATELSNLESSIRSTLNNLNRDTDFTLLIAADDGKRFEHSVGNSSADTSYRSASTSKFVTSAVLLSLVFNDEFFLSDQPQDYIPAWPTNGNLSDITLAHLLSFTSGLNEEALCIDLPNADPSSCGYSILTNNLSNLKIAGEEFYYSSSHMQIAGLMAINALEANSWQEVFNLFRTRTGLFTNSFYDLPSLTNPRLAGGMHWTANDYLDFLKAIYEQTILTPELIIQMTSDQLTDSIIVNSPAIIRINEDWHYGFGNWIECHSDSFNCSQVSKVSSPGAYGAYPFIDFTNNYYGILAREGKLGTFSNGYEAFAMVEDQLKLWAGMSCR